MNYVGGKYRLLPQILPLFPNRINTFVDLFCGGVDVATNVQADHKIANDINCYIIDIYKYFQSVTIADLLDRIESLISEYNLSRTNEAGYKALRTHYNENPSAIELFVLICFAFNNQIRFNNSHQYNSTFGRNRSDFNNVLKSNLVKFHENIKGIEFVSMNYRDFDYAALKPGDFLYADPPYLISTGTYNDGKRGFKGWSKADDQCLFSILDDLSDQGVNFALSNVFENKGLVNEPLIEWSEKYNVYNLDRSYNHCCFCRSEKTSKTVEVLITNY